MLIVGHGSRLKGFDKPVRALARDLVREGWSPVECAFLEITSPTVEEGLQALVKKGARDIRILPYFLLIGRHVMRDLPRLVSSSNRRLKGRVKISLCPYLGYDQGIFSTVKKRLGRKR